jgi:phospholipase C
MVQHRSLLTPLSPYIFFITALYLPCCKIHSPPTVLQRPYADTFSAPLILQRQGEKMFAQSTWKKLAHSARVAVAVLTAIPFSLGGTLAYAAPDKDKDKENKGKSHGTASPIQHVIIIVGENRSFDHVFATYKPKHGEKVDNLLSKGIIKEDGTPGPNFSKALQYQADVSADPTFEPSPANKTPYGTLPPPLTGGPSDVCKNNGVCTLSDATSSENGLPTNYYPFMLTGGSEQGSHVPDVRIANVNNLPPGPFQLTSSTFSYDDYAASPVHRFYQMWQQLDCNASYASKGNESGCKADLFPWVEVTVGAGTNGKAQSTTFTNTTTGEGSTSMGFYNVLQGDAPYFNYLADHYSMSDNYHQPGKGGTGLDSLYLGFADAIYFENADGSAGVPPHNQLVYSGTPDAGVVDEIENPNPQPGTNNWYIEDGYGSGSFGPNPVSGGGSYTNCSDTNQPGVGPIVNYLSSLKRPVKPNCDPGHYYLLNNYNPGYFGNGANAYTDVETFNTPFTIPPTNQRSIGDVLNEAGVSWKYYGDQYNAYTYGFPNAQPPIPPDPLQLNYGTVGAASDQYCNICNPFQYETAIMADASVRTAHLKDTIDLYNDIAAGNLPAVSWVKPSGWVDGHPASSKLDLFEGFAKKIVDAVRANKELWESTAIFITVDEGGGYYDSGYVQNLEYFGDGTRIPLIVVSPFTEAGHISHSYTDHASTIKFIERNWNLPTITGRSRDNLPNPKPGSGSDYVPANTPALGDLWDLFSFGDHGKSGEK